MGNRRLVHDSMYLVVAQPRHSSEAFEEGCVRTLLKALAGPLPKQLQWRLLGMNSQEGYWPTVAERHLLNPESRHAMRRFGLLVRSVLTLVATLRRGKEEMLLKWLP